MNVSLAQAAAALNANSRWQQVISENLASSSTPGFRREDVSFKSIQAGMMATPAEKMNSSRSPALLPKANSVTIFEPGELSYTGIETNLGLEGSGFFEIQLPDESLAYTRNGEFKFNTKGELVTNSGFQVMGEGGPIQVDPKNPQPIVISPSGDISQGPDMRGKVKVVDFNDPQLLTCMGGGYFLASNSNIQPSTPEETTVRQNFLEASNTTPAREMASLLGSMRTYEANQKVIQVTDERMSRVINELGNPS
jgi:flagellar basal body rod protein FlgG